MARPRWLVASRSIRPLRTIAGPAVIASSVHCRAVRSAQRLLLRRCGRSSALVPSAAEARWNRWASFGVVKLQGSGNRVENGGRHPGQRAAFQLGVVLDADPSECGDLTAAQPGHPPVSDVGQSGQRPNTVRLAGFELTTP
jgi:hypothetical protein